MLDFESAIGRGWTVMTFVAFGGGFLTALTPCVYPLIPITVSIFGARKASSRLQAAALSGTYVLGIAVMYSILGVAAALTGAAFGTVMTNPWIVGFIALLLVAMAISMFGAFELQLPSSLQNRLQGVAGPGYFGALGMGLVAGVIAAPCTGPVLAGVLAFIASTRDLVLGVWLMFVFALGMGAPFFAIGTFSFAMPKTGAWTDAVKSVFGIVLLAAALYFVKDVFPPVKALLSGSPNVLAAYAALVFLGILLGAVHLSFHEGAIEKSVKAGGVTLATLGSFGLLAGLLVGEAAAPGSEVPWVRSEEEGLRQAAAQKRPVLMDFTADWCVACKELEHKTYPDVRVRKALERFVPVMIDATNPRTPEIKRLAKKYAIRGYPTVVLIGSDGNRLDDLTIHGFKTPDELLEILRRVG